MKKILAAGLVLALVFGVALLGGCGNDSTETTTETAETTAPMEEEKAETESQASAPETSSDIPEAKPGAYTDLTPTQAKELVDATPGLVIIDVSPHYADGHISGAVNYYLGDGSLEKAIPTLDKNGTYLVYCHVDSASIGGAEALVEAGFEKVYRLEGNYAAWVDAGYPIEK